MTRFKRTHDELVQEGNSPSSQFIPMFESFRVELDEHYDRRERIIKVSRDITSLSKKMIFSMQRVKSLKKDIPPTIAAECAQRSESIVKLFEVISPDLQGVNSWRYQRQVSPGLQEYIEAVSFDFYLRNQRLITPQEVSQSILARVSINIEDYILGIFDLVGEMMRFAITTMATTGVFHSSRDEDPIKDRTILGDLRFLRSNFEKLDTSASNATGLGKDVEKKMEVMKTCVEKVETSVYGMIVRGRERPPGWAPEDADEQR